MSNVTLAIGGRSYTVACDPGQEAHIQRLGRAIDARLDGMAGLAGQSEARTLLFAALLLADELHEKGGGTPAPQAPAPSPAVADDLEALAGRLESLAEQLEGAA